MKKYKIVIVENDEDEQFFMKEAFDAKGLFDIMAIVRNGDMLFRWLEENKDHLPDIILSDLNMPGKNGYDVINETNSNPVYAHIPVVITSTSSTKTIMQKCLNIGAAAYLVKPETFIEYGPFAEKFYALIVERNWGKKLA